MTFDIFAYSTDNPYENYNFYKDSNITEALACVDVLNRLEKRVNIELDQWPDHAVLNDVSRFELENRHTI